MKLSIDSVVNDQSRRYTYAILEHMPIGVALYDAETLILLAANSLWHTFLGPRWQGGQAIGLTLTDWLPDAESNGNLAIFRLVAETGQPYRAGEYIFTAFERGTTHWSWTLNPIRDCEGRITHLIQTVTEITNQVNARKKAAEEQAQLNAINQKIEAGHKRLEVIETVARSVRECLDIESISQAVIEAISANFDTLFVHTYTADPLQPALNLLHVHPTTDQGRSIGYRKRIPYDSESILSTAYKQREPIIIENVQTLKRMNELTRDNPLVTHAQGFVCIPLWFNDNFEGTLSAVFKEPVTMDSVSVQALIGSGTHVAAAFAHARLHATVENERTRLSAIIDQLPEGILITESTNGLISYANEAAAHILGIPRDQVLNTPLNQSTQASVEIDANGRPMFPWNFIVIQALCGETVNSQETTVIRPNGTKVVTLSSSAPLYSEKNLITGAVIVFQDVTAQKSVEQQKSEFLSIASHELRTPITAIQGYAEILQLYIEQGRGVGPHSQHALSIINEQSLSLTRLIEEMLDLTRIEHTQLLLNFASHDLVNVLASVIETQATMAKHHQLVFVLDGLQATDVLMGFFDRRRIEQVVNNLISNAIKYSPEGGEIEIGLRYSQHTPHEVTFWVKDSGIGIAANELPHIFKRFHRAAAIDHSISGLGIGLYLVKELVTLHGGTVWAESQEESGSTFFVQLPINKRG